MGVPETPGAVVFTGAVAPVTAAVRFENAVLDPALFLAMTRDRICLPESVPVRVYVVFVAVEMFEHEPLTTHRCHWYVNVGAGLPVHVPEFVVRSCPTEAVPLTTGMAVFVGAAAALACSIGTAIPIAITVGHSTRAQRRTDLSMTQQSDESANSYADTVNSSPHSPAVQSSPVPSLQRPADKQPIADTQQVLRPGGQSLQLSEGQPDVWLPGLGVAKPVGANREVAVEVGGWTGDVRAFRERPRLLVIRVQELVVDDVNPSRGSDDEVCGREVDQCNAVVEQV